MRRRLGASIALLASACATVPAAAAPPPYWSIDNATANEEDGQITFVLHKTGDNGKASKIRLITRNGSALAGADYVGSTFDVSVPSGTKVYTRTVPLIDDGYAEPPENLSLVVKPISNARLLDDGNGYGAIADADTTPIPPPTAPEPTPTDTATQTPTADPDPGATTTTQVCWDGSTIPASDPCPVQPAPEPTPPPPPPPDPSPTTEPTTTPTIAGVDSIPSNFDINTQLSTIPIPKSAAPDVVGAFRFTCQPGQLLYDDPIVYPGQPGKSHLHQFFGNTEANGNSTYPSLRGSGESTCNNKLNRSAYWMPAMIDNAFVYRPDHVQIYYKRRPSSDPKCNSATVGAEVGPGGSCIPLPRGLRFVFGYDMVTGKAPTGATYFMCSSGTVAVTDSTHKPDIPTAMATCIVGNRLSVSIKAPACWAPVLLDSPNHRDHVAYPIRNSNTGVLACPATHPHLIPTFTLTSVWVVTPELKAAADAGTLRFTSDDMVPAAPHGTTFHSDWFGAWDDVVKHMWEVEGCIDKMLNCSDGDTGTGKKIIPSAKTAFPSLPQRVAIPVKP